MAALFIYRVLIQSGSGEMAPSQPVAIIDDVVAPESPILESVSTKAEVPITAEKITTETATRRTTPQQQPKAVATQYRETQQELPPLQVPILETIYRSSGSHTVSKPEPNSFMVVHSFDYLNNANRFKSKLDKHGYETEIRKQNNGWHSVGVHFNDSAIHTEGLRQALAGEYDARPKLWTELPSTH